MPPAMSKLMIVVFMQPLIKNYDWWVNIVHWTIGWSIKTLLKRKLSGTHQRRNNEHKISLWSLYPCSLCQLDNVDEQSMPAHDYCLLFRKQQSIASYLCEQRWRNSLSSSFFRIFAQVDQTDLFCGLVEVKTYLIRPMAVPTPMAVQVETSTASNPRWETHLSVRNSPGNRGWGEKIRTYLTVRMTLTKPKRWS